MRGAHPAAAQLSEPVDPNTPEQVMFDLDTTARITVPVQIGDYGPVPFIVDTGSTRTVIARELADHLNLADGPMLKIHSMSELTPARTVIIPSLEVNGRTLKRIAAPALASSNLHAAGIIGLDALKAQYVVVDFPTGLMTITTASAPRDPPIPEREENVIVVTAKSRLGQLVLADASIDDQKVLVIIDTGGQVSIGNEPLRRILGANVQRPWKKIELEDVTGGITVADYTTVEKLRIANLRIGNLPIAFADAHPFRALDLRDKPALLLGMETLRMFDRITLDFGKHKVAFTWPRGGGPTP